jgi:hypothetical protein
MLFTTYNSTYEIDQEHARIRRLEGLNKPTPRQGADGDWKSYVAISPVSIGLCVTIIWRVVDGVGQGSQTGPVQQIIEVLN